MRADFIRMTSTTGGTGTLTCTAQTGYPIVSNAFTGTRLVDYSIAEYTDSTKVTLSKSETGIGSYNTSTEVLTRTKVLSTWSGSAYLPKFATATAPSAISFGTTAANIDIMISPMAGGIIPPVPFVYDAVASVADGLGAAALNMTAQSTLVLTSGTVYYWPVLIVSQGPFSRCTIRTTAALTGGTPTFDHALYEIGSNGRPGKQLIKFTQITAVGTTNTTYTSTALATPVYLVPGWYWAAALHVANSATGSFTVRSGSLLLGGPQGSLWSAAAVFGGKTLPTQTVLNDPATAPTANPASANFPVLTWV